MTSISKDWHIYKSEVIVSVCNITCNRTIKMKPIDIVSNLYIEIGVENND